AALSMEREEVFTATHELVLRLLAEGRIDGLRIDHPDGLYDPRQYLRRLQERFVLAVARRLFDTRPEYQGPDWGAVEGPLREQIEKALFPPLPPGPPPRGASCQLARLPPGKLAACPTGGGAGEGEPPPWPLYVVVEKILGTGEALPDDCPAAG